MIILLAGFFGHGVHEALFVNRVLCVLKFSVFRKTTKCEHFVWRRTASITLEQITSAGCWWQTCISEALCVGLYLIGNLRNRRKIRFDDSAITVYSSTGTIIFCTCASIFSVTQNRDYSEVSLSKWCLKET